MAETASDVVKYVRPSERISETVIAAVAEAKDVDPLELDPIYTVVDPDALDSLVPSSGSTSSSTLEVCFSMAGCQVVIHDNYEVVVTELAENDGSTVPIAPHEE